MDSILSRLSRRGRIPFDTGSNNTNDPNKRRSSSVRSRKSISSLFKRQDGTQQANCQERAHYPLYDPSNPEHHGPPTSSVSADRAERITPKKSRLQSIAQGLQDTLRAKATYFYVQRTPDRPIASPTSSASKKTVRFREGHSSIDEETQLATTFLGAIPQYSPELLRLSFSQTSLLPMTACPTEWHAQKDAGTTNPPGYSPVILPSPVCEPVPMLGTILLLDDPFDDIHTTEDDPVKALGLPISQQVVVGQVSASRVSSGNHDADSERSCVKPSLSRSQSSHSGTDEDTSVLTDVRYSTAMAIDESGPPSPKPGRFDYTAPSPLAAKSNSLPLRGFYVEMKETDVCELAAKPLGQENVPVASRRECDGKVV